MKMFYPNFLICLQKTSQLLAETEMWMTSNSIQKHIQSTLPQLDEFSTESKFLCNLYISVRFNQTWEENSCKQVQQGDTRSLHTNSTFLRERWYENALISFCKSFMQPYKIIEAPNHCLLRSIVFRKICLRKHVHISNPLTICELKKVQIRCFAAILCGAKS